MSPASTQAAPAQAPADAVTAGNEQAKRRAPTPKALQKRKWTINAAAEEWAQTTKAIEGLKIIQADAAKFLLDTAERTERRTFGDRIAVVQTGGSFVLDQPAVKERLSEIGDRVEDFMKKTKLGLALKLLK
jgi:hypothetical protein